MDTITQGLLGAVTAQLGFRQHIGRDATLVATVAAIVPDMDIIVRPFLELTGIESSALAGLGVHRGISHSLLITPITAFLLALLWWWCRRGVPQQDPPKFLALYACTFIAVLSHPLLDVCTSYGTQLLTPITNARYAIDAIAIIDIIYSPILIVTLLVCFIARKTAKHPKKASLIAGITGFTLSVIYIAAGYTCKHIAIAQAKPVIEQLHPAANTAQYRAYPQLGSIFVWRITRRTDTDWTAGRVNVLFGPVHDKSRWNNAPIETSPWIEKADKLPHTQAFNNFAMNQLRATYDKRSGFRIVDYHDMRYGSSPESLTSLWSLQVTFHASGEIIDIGKTVHHRSRSVQQVAAQSLTDIVNP